LVNNLEYLVEPDAAITAYYKSRKIMFTLILANILLGTLIGFYVMRNESIILQELERVYKLWHVDRLKKAFEMISIASFTLNMLLYIQGFYAMFSHKVTSL
jgi:hypothetical protein